MFSNVRSWGNVLSLWPNVTFIYLVIFCKSVLYKVEFQAIDGAYMTSPPIVVHISIRAAETNAPRVSWNMGTKFYPHNIMCLTETF